MIGIEPGHFAGVRKHQKTSRLLSPAPLETI
jgi:hypothetical protein